MKHIRLFRWCPNQETLFATVLFLLMVCLNIVANLFNDSAWFFLFYQGALVLGLGIVTPLWYIRTTNQSVDSIGLTLTNWKKAVVYGLLIICVSVPWRFAGLHLPKQFAILLSTSVALLMTSFFEEVFFRGFLQTRFEKAFGAIPAIVLSGLTFSLYHLGYPDYQNVKLLFQLLLVGLFFAIAFRITNNVITSFLVNLPHAIISFVEKGSYFSTKVAVISGFTTVLGLCLIIYFYGTYAKSK